MATGSATTRTAISAASISPRPPTANRHNAVRVKNLGTNVGEDVTDNLAIEALAKFPAGVAPDYCFMNRRPLE